MGLMRKGSLLMPRDNDSAFLLDKHKRGLQNLDRMAHYRDNDPVDLAVVGAGAAAVAWRGARNSGIEMKVGPVAITNGVFGNRPHCTYRGFCLEGCKVNSKASPLITHLPDAIEHGCEVRADSMAVRVEVKGDGGQVTGVTYVHEGREEFQPADAVAVCGYAIESPRLLLNSTSRHWPNGLANDHDLVGRYVMVQGATQVAARFPMELRMYKAPPPEISSEHFYETDQSRGFARGFSIQTVGPLPIEWSTHVMADGHWGASLREYMRDYNHWTVLGVLCELLPAPDNRVTLAEEKDQYGLPVARFDYTQGDNDKKNIVYATRILEEIWEGAGAQDTLKIDRYAHLVGGCRMGFTPEDSVVDSSHRAWGLENLYIVDGSVFPTQGAANPALPIMALADRCADLLKGKRSTVAA